MDVVLTFQVVNMVALAVAFSRWRSGCTKTLVTELCQEQLSFGGGRASWNISL